MPNVHNMNSPYTPTYEPPEPFTPPSVNAYARQFDGTVFEQSQAAITHAQKEFHRHIDRVNQDRQHYTDAGYKAQIDKFTDTGAYQDITRHVDQVRARRDQAQAAYDKIRRELSPDGDTAAELRATRYWNRTRAILDTEDTGGVIARGRELLATATPAELGTLLQELQPYCTARGVSSSEWIDATAAQVSPKYGRAAKQLTKAKQAAIITEHNASRLQSAISNRQQVPIPLADRVGDYDPDR